MSKTNFHGAKAVRAKEVLMFLYQSYDILL